MKITYFLYFIFIFQVIFLKFHPDEKLRVFFHKKHEKNNIYKKKMIYFYLFLNKLSFFIKKNHF